MGRGWCQTLGIASPRLEAVAGHREANTFALLLVALLERDEPATLADVAARFDEAGIADRASALVALRRCRPGRPPVHREGDLYALDPHDEDLALWVFQLGLRPPRVVVPRTVVDPAPLPGPDVALSVAELDEAWTGASLHSWSAQRLAVAVLDAHGGPLAPAEVVAAVSGRTKWHVLRAEVASFRYGGSPIEVLADGRWAIRSASEAALLQARVAVRERVALARRHAAMRPDPAALAASRAEWEQKRAAHGAELAAMSRALLVAFPPARPQAVALLDVEAHEITTFVGDELASLGSRLARYEILGAMDVRNLLRALDFDPGKRRLAELGPPQKSMRLNKSGRTLKITTALLVQGSCGISSPFGDAKRLTEYLASGDLTKLRRRLEADVKSLHALYEYGRLHGAVRLRWGFLDERIAAPWVHHDERRLYDLKTSALAMNVPLEVVAGSAPGWSDPWSRVRLAYVEKHHTGWGTRLVDEHGVPINEADVQRARLPMAVH